MQNSDNSPISLPYSYTPGIWPALITLAIVVYLGSYSWRRRDIPAAKPFALACLLGGFWTIGVILELLAVDFSTKVFWLKFQSVWQLPVAAAITCFILQYAGLNRWLNRITSASLFVIPALSVLLMVTNNFHHLIWTEFRMSQYVIASSGRLYWFIYSYVYLLGVVNSAVLVRLAIRSPSHRLPAAIIVCGQIVARVGYTIDKLEVIGPGESTLLTFGVVSVTYALAFLRFHLIDPVTAARRAALQQMSEGLIVLDLQGRIVDVNPMAAAMVGVPENNLFAKRLTDVMPVDPGFLELSDNAGEGRTDMTLGKGNSARHYSLKLMPLRARRGEVIGRLLMVHEVTEQRRAQTQLLEQQGVVATLKERERLARELHDGIGQVLAFVGMQTTTALKWMKDREHGKAESLLARLVEVANDAHADLRESILGLKISSGQQWSFIPALKEHIRKFQSNYGLGCELALCDGIDENTFDIGTGVHLLRAIQEAMTNARRHSGANKLTVRLEQKGNKAQIIISDNGCGFDVNRSADGSGSQLGLNFIRERMEQIGGRLKVESMPGSGTTLKLKVPVRKREEGSR